MEDLSDPPISISAAARQIGVDQSTLSKQVRQGLVRSHNGKVRLSEVLADRAANIDLSRSKRRDGAIDMPEAPAKRAAAPARPAPVQTEDGDGEDDAGATVIIDGVPRTYAEARAMKEGYLAQLKRIEFEAKRGEQAPIKHMLDRMDRDYAVVRERLLTLPGKWAATLDVNQLATVTDDLYEALEDLNARGVAADLEYRSSRPADDGEDDSP